MANSPIHDQLRRRQIAGLLLVGGLVLLAALLRADSHVLFAPGWWRVW